jgi:hypothetical protein
MIFCETDAESVFEAVSILRMKREAPKFIGKSLGTPDLRLDACTIAPKFWHSPSGIFQAK